VGGQEVLVAQARLLARVPLQRGGEKPDSDVAVGFGERGLGQALVVVALKVDDGGSSPAGPQTAARRGRSLG
jgi:hypothetical protein